MEIIEKKCGVIKIITDNDSNYKKVGKELEKKYKLHWTPCADQCINLVFEGVENERFVKNAITRGDSSQNSYVIMIGWVVAQIREICGCDLIYPGTIIFATNFLLYIVCYVRKMECQDFFIVQIGSILAKGSK